MALYTHYEILGVSNHASAEQIRSAYRALVQRVHPDGGGTAGVFDFVQQAYEVLSDPDKRRAYDAHLLNGDDFQGEDFDGGKSSGARESGSEQEEREESAYERESRDEERDTDKDAGSNGDSYRYLRGRGFELFLVHAFRRAGIQVRHTPELVGIDFSMDRDGRRVVIQATGSAHPIGPNVVGEISWARDHYGAASAMVITNSVFSASAKHYANRVGVRLWDGEQLKRFLDKGNWPDGDSWDFRQDPNTSARNSQGSTRFRRQYSVPAKVALSIGLRHPFAAIFVVLLGLLVLFKLLAAWIGLIFWGFIIFAIARSVRGRLRAGR